MRHLIPALLLLLALPVRAEINKPSFECFSQTSTAVETLLCEDPLLGAWEGQLAARAESAGSDAVAAHRAWLQGLGAGCGRYHSEQNTVRRNTYVELLNALLILQQLFLNKLQMKISI